MYNKTPWKSWLKWTHLVFNVMLVLYVCLRVFVPLENVSLIWKCHHCRWWATSFDLWSALMVIEQWGFFSVTHQLCYGASFNNGHLRGPVTLTPIAERLAVELSLPIFKTKVCRGWDSNTQTSACENYDLTHCTTAAVTAWYFIFIGIE